VRRGLNGAREVEARPAVGYELLTLKDVNTPDKFWRYLDSTLADRLMPLSHYDAGAPPDEHVGSTLAAQNRIVTKIRLRQAHPRRHPPRSNPRRGAPHPRAASAPCARRCAPLTFRTGGGGQVRVKPVPCSTLDLNPRLSAAGGTGLADKQCYPRYSADAIDMGTFQGESFIAGEVLEASPRPDPHQPSPRLPAVPSPAPDLAPDRKLDQFMI